MFCSRCGKQLADGATFCAYCGASTTGVMAGEQLKSKLAAGLLGIFLGGWGIHRFYLGYVGIGVTQIIVTIITLGAGSLWGFIEGIMILAGSFNKDAKGQPLKE
jgi:TM2 domain-containing membrane protein YozV